MKKGFNLKIYAAVTFFVIAGLLATITVTTYKNRYNGFSPEKTAVAFVQSIVETGDGYNAYKNTIVSKNYKYGDFIREYYMFPVIYAECDYEIGADTGNLKGFNDESYMGEKTLNDDGSLSGQVIDTMYDYYAKLMKKYKGWDNYDAVFTDYFKELCKVREEVFGDKYMTDEIMFTALESNVRTYGESLTGTEDEFDANTGIQTSVKTIGTYEKVFGEDYKFTYEVKETLNLSGSNAPWSKIDDHADKLKTYKTSTDDMSELIYVVVEIKANGETIATQEVHVVKIKSTWYVNNTTINTTALYELA